MISAQAYSFRLKSRLAVSLSWIAGYTNVIGLIACGQTTSHQTGNVTHFGGAVGNAILGRAGAGPEVFYFGFLILFFLLGAIFSGLLTEGARRHGRSSKYIFPMSIEAMLLCGMLLLLLHHPQLSLQLPNDRSLLLLLTGMGAFAMGLQNATITKISGAVVRTTHLTGVVTDLGLELVQMWNWWRDKMHAEKKGKRYLRIWLISRRHPTVLRVLLLSSILSSFLFGATAGTILFEKIGPTALLAPILFLCGMVLLEFFTPVADVREIDPTRDHDLGLSTENLKSLLPPDVGIFRLSHRKPHRHHQAPDFRTWVDRIPRRWHVVILIISPLTQFDTDTAASLLSAVQILKSHNRTLVISGMNRVQFKTLIDCGLTKIIEIENFVPDVEFAIARGLNLSTNSENKTATNTHE